MAYSDSNSEENPTPVFGNGWDSDDSVEGYPPPYGNDWGHNNAEENIPPSTPHVFGINWDSHYGAAENPPMEVGNDWNNDGAAEESHPPIPVPTDNDSVEFGEITTVNFIVRLRKIMTDQNSVTIPDDFVFSNNILHFEDVELNCPATGYQLQCTLHKHTDGHTQDSAVSSVAIMGDFEWFKTANGWKYGEHIKFEKRSYGDRLVFDVDSIVG